MAVDVRINTVSTSLSVVDRDALLSPEVLAVIVAAVRARLAEDALLAQQRDRDRHVDHGGRR